MGAYTTLRRFWRHRDTGHSQPVRMSRYIVTTRGLIVKHRVDRLVELAGTSHRRTLCRLPHGGNDPCLRFHLQSRLHSSKLAGLATHNVDFAHTCMHQQHAHEVDREFQLGWIDIQYHCPVYCSYPHPVCDQQRVTRATSLYPCERCVERLLCWNRLPQRCFDPDDIRCCYLDHEVKFNP